MFAEVEVVDALGTVGVAAGEEACFARTVEVAEGLLAMRTAQVHPYYIMVDSLTN